MIFILIFPLQEIDQDQEREGVVNTFSRKMNSIPFILFIITLLENMNEDVDRALYAILSLKIFIFATLLG